MRTTPARYQRRPRQRVKQAANRATTRARKAPALPQDGRSPVHKATTTAPSGPRVSVQARQDAGGLRIPATGAAVPIARDSVGHPVKEAARLATGRARRTRFAQERRSRPAWTVRPCQGVRNRHAPNRCAPEIAVSRPVGFWIHDDIPLRLHGLRSSGLGPHTSGTVQ